MNEHNVDVVADFGWIEVETNDAFCGDATWNGCGPSSLPDFLSDALDAVSGFQDQCNEHDVCYADCETPREVCEENFHTDMEAECAWYDILCNFLADLFHASVYYLGGDICFDSRDHCTLEEQNTCYF